MTEVVRDESQSKRLAPIRDGRPPRRARFLPEISESLDTESAHTEHVRQARVVSRGVHDAESSRLIDLGQASDPRVVYDEGDYPRRFACALKAYRAAVNRVSYLD